MLKYLLGILLLLPLVAFGEFCPKGYQIQSDLNIINVKGIFPEQLFINGDFHNGTNNWIIEDLTEINIGNEYVSMKSDGGEYARLKINDRVIGHTYLYLIKGFCSGKDGVTFGSRNAAGVSGSWQSNEIHAFIDTFPSNGSNHPFIHIDNRTCYIDKSFGFQCYDLTDMGLDNAITTPEQAIKYFNNNYYEGKKYELPVLGECLLCPPNTYKDFVGNDNCTPCPNGTMSPSGSISVNECGRVMRVDGKLYLLKSVKQTSPSLNVMDEYGHVFYGNLYSPE